jgi:hypothetical protein
MRPPCPLAVVMSTEHPASVDLLPHQLHSHRLLNSLTESVARNNIRGELPRIHLLRSWVNKGKKRKGRGCYAPTFLRLLALCARLLLTWGRTHSSLFAA